MPFSNSSSGKHNRWKWSHQYNPDLGLVSPNELYHSEGIQIHFKLNNNGTFTQFDGSGAAGLGLDPIQLVGESIYDVFAGVPAFTDMVVRAIHGRFINTQIKLGNFHVIIGLFPEKDAQEKLVSIRGFICEISDSLRQLQDFDTLLSIVSGIRFATDVQSMKKVLISQVESLFNVQACGLGFIKPWDHSSIDPDAHDSRWGSWIGEWNAEIEQMCNHVLDIGQLYLRKDDYYLSQTREVNDADRFSTAACIPLNSRGVTVGVLWIARATDFSYREEALLREISQLIAKSMQRIIANEHQESLYHDTVRSIINCLDNRVSINSFHSQEITRITRLIAKEIGCKDEITADIELASMLHDVGKLIIPDQILLKKGSLTDGEWLIVKMHPETGARIASQVKALERVVPLILHHHEHFDGSGYPAGLKGAQIPLGARIISVVDSYCAMIEDRVYKPAVSQQNALEELNRCAGFQFDPLIVQIFRERIFPYEGASYLYKQKSSYPIRRET